MELTLQHWKGAGPLTVLAASCLVSLVAGIWNSRRTRLAFVRRDWGVFTLPWVMVFFGRCLLTCPVFVSIRKHFDGHTLSAAPLCVPCRLTYALTILIKERPWYTQVASPSPTCWMTACPLRPYLPYWQRSRRRGWRETRLSRWAITCMLPSTWT